MIGTASARHHDALRALGVTPVDYRTEDVPGRVRELAPGGVDAVFTHIGGRSVRDSWRLLAPGGTLVSYGSAATRDNTGSRQWPVLKILGRVWLWNALPDGRRAYFFAIWAGRAFAADRFRTRLRAGRAFATDRFRTRLRADLTEVFAAQRHGEITARVAAVLPLARVAEALRFAEPSTGRARDGHGTGTGPARSSAPREASRHEASGRTRRMRLRARR